MMERLVAVGIGRWFLVCGGEGACCVWLHVALVVMDRHACPCMCGCVWGEKVEGRVQNGDGSTDSRDGE